MKNFIKNHFKFIFCVVWFTYLFSSFSRNSKREFDFIQSKMELFDYQLDYETTYIGKKINELEVKMKESSNLKFNLLIDSICEMARLEVKIAFEIGEKLEKGQIQIEEKICEVGNGLKESIKIIYEEQIKSKER